MEERQRKQQNKYKKRGKIRMNRDRKEDTGARRERKKK